MYAIYTTRYSKLPLAVDYWLMTDVSSCQEMKEKEREREGGRERGMGEEGKCHLLFELRYSKLRHCFQVIMWNYPNG